MVPVQLRRVLLAEYRIDFRKGLDGLLGEAYRLGAQPYDGDCVIFIKKDHTQLRAIVGDGLGLYLVTRRFEGGGLRSLLRFAAHPSAKTISTGELSLLLEGASFTVHQRAKAWRPRATTERSSSTAPLAARAESEAGADDVAVVDGHGRAQCELQPAEQGEARSAHCPEGDVVVARAVGGRLRAPREPRETHACA